MSTLLQNYLVMIVVPNNKIWGSIITNVNPMSTPGVELVFGIGYKDESLEGPHGSPSGAL